jgi:tetratricopeptide (TPR) repeat protein
MHGALTRFAAVCLVAIAAQAALADSCRVAAPPVPTPAEESFLAADYDKAAALFRAGLATEPNDPRLTAGLLQVLLHQQKVDEAATIVNAAVTAKPGSAVLLAAKGEVEYRQGLPWDAARSFVDAGKADPCLARVHLDYARTARLNSAYATARSEIETAHKLDPYDPDIHGEWIATLSPRERVAELEKYLASKNGKDAEEQRHMQQLLDHLKKTLDEPHKPCRLVSTTASTEIPFAPLMYDVRHIRAFGLDVKLNEHRAKLEIDTGAGGLLVSRSVAQHAGLKSFSEVDVGGIGDQGKKTGYVAFADSIQIGNLEFHDCAVRVLDNSRMMDIDGLIGMDVFSKFLVTLNYPDRKLSLGPLPVRPGEAPVAPSLGTGTSEEDDAQKTAPASTAQPPGTAAGPAGSPSTNPSGTLAETPAAAPKTLTARGPFNRYIAPEMKDYTPVYRVGHALILPVALNLSKLKLFILDTGAWATSISPNSAREVTKVHSNDREHVQGLAGSVDRMYTADNINFAFAKVSQSIRDVPSFDTSQVSKDTGIEISGFLGARTLELTTIHIDYRDGLVKFDYDPIKARQQHPLY